jgi:signal transduction histidine kinase/DNA-binding response OmpR family regulator/ABC-type phosphate/phosphonate transport system substrate-binding protein
VSRLARSLLNGFAVLAVLLTTCATQMPAWASHTAEHALKLGVFAYRDKAETLARWQPLADHLSHVLGDTHVELHVLDTGEIRTALQENMLDFVLTNQRHFIELRHESALSGAVATVVEMQDGHPVPAMGGAIVVRADNPAIATLADLRGKRVATSGKGLMGSYAVQTYELANADVPLDALHIDEVGLPQDRVVEAVLAGRADAGFVRTGMIERMAIEGKIDVSRLRFIHRQELPGYPFTSSTQLYPEWPFISLPQVDARMARRVAAALLSIEPGDPVARAAGIYGFAAPADYEPVEMMMREPRMAPFDHAAPITWRELWAQHGLVLAGLIVSLFLILVLLLVLLFNLLRLSEARRAAEENARQLTIDRLALRARMKELSCLYAVFQITESPRTDIIEMLQAVANRIPAGTHHPEHAAVRIAYADCRIESPGFRETRWRIDLEFDGTPGHPDSLTVAYREMPPGQTNPLDDPFFTEEREMLAAIGERLASVIDSRRAHAELDRHRHHLEELVIERTHQLEEARDAAEAANRAKSTFLANMSHEIRTPMNAIVGLSYLVQRESADPKQQHRLSKVGNAAQHLLALINDILDLSKIEAGRLVLEAKDFVPTRVIDDVCGLMRDKAREKGLAWRVVLDPELPERLNGDSLRLRQVLINFASNAVKFTEQGSIALAVTCLPPVGEQQWLRFAVSDTGIGLSAETRARLFQPFEQADISTTRRFGGTGLGLAIVKRIAELFGGRVGVESVPGEGSTFWIEAPFAPARGDAETASRAERNDRPDKAGGIEQEPEAADFGAGASGFSRHAAARILLAEDNPVNREVVLDLLDAVGLAADIAGNGREALELVRTERYDLILMDVQMPEMDGIEAAQRIRALSGGATAASVPIVAMTANVFEEDRRRCLDAGMNDHVPKPVSPASFYAMLCRWLPIAGQGAGAAAPEKVGAGETAPMTVPITAPPVDIPMPDLPGLDVVAGLASVSGRTATYLRLLKLFVEHHGDVITQIRAALAVGQRDEARRLAHSLKGAASTLGAEPLRAAALTVELAVKAAADTVEIEAELAALAILLDPLVAGLRTFLAGAAAGSD